MDKLTYVDFASSEYHRLARHVVMGLAGLTPNKAPKEMASIKPEFFMDGELRALFKDLMSGERDLMVLKEHFKSPTKAVDILTKKPYLSAATIVKFRDMVYDIYMRKAITDENWNDVERILKERRLEPDKDAIEEYEEYKKEYKELSGDGIMGMSTGIEKLDSATLGLIPNHIWVCGAYYGYGKTYFAINLINSLLDQGKRCVFFTLEMTSVEIIQRLVAMRAKFGLVETVGKLDEKRLKLREEAEEAVYDAIKEKRLIIDDSSRDSNGVITKMLSEEGKQHVDFVAIDYIQLLAGKDQYESLREASKNLQGATKQMRTTTLILSQVNNAAQKEGAGSRVDGFKGAGDIGQIANVAIKIMRERDIETGEFSPFYGLRLTKVRHSKPCSIPCKIEFPGGKITDKGAEAPKPVDEVSSMFEGL